MNTANHFRSYITNVNALVSHCCVTVDGFLKMYYTPVADRKNLTVLANAYATEIVTNKGENGKLVATSVKFLHDEEQKVYEVKVSKEVCLSAGLVVAWMPCGWTLTRLIRQGYQVTSGNVSMPRGC